ncbi:hypothetical protein GWK47_054873 [Chionoecetes opilio]|uniref:RNase H type-1 domain-containing protein n=1 Tax=Chionoecetes opilio TaxID=41210 RepID=A0A8J4Y9C3_CHIOP|nr:hypothetical protein GWK47_054873 [Chionoecetes opilio]
MAMAQVAERDAVYTSLTARVDPDSGRTGAAFVTTGGTELSWRTSNNCSTLQTGAGGHPPRPRTCPAPPGGKCGNTHRLLDGAAGPPTAASQGQREAHHHHLGSLQSLVAQGRRVRLNWIPSKVGVRGNEAADATRPPSEPPAAPASPCTCLPAYSSSRRRRDGPQHTALTRPHRELEGPEEAGGLVRFSHRLPPTGRPPSNNPGQMAHYCSLCVLATAPERTAGGLRGTSVRPLRDAHPSPTGALPPALPRHRPPEPGPAPAAHLQVGGC